MSEKLPEEKKEVFSLHGWGLTLGVGVAGLAIGAGILMMASGESEKEQKYPSLLSENEEEEAIL